MCQHNGQSQHDTQGLVTRQIVGCHIAAAVIAALEFNTCVMLLPLCLVVMHAAS